MSIEFVAGNTEFLSCGSDTSLDDIAIKTVSCFVKVDDISANYYLVTKGKPGTNTGWTVDIDDQAGTSDFKFSFLQGFANQHGSWQTDSRFTYGLWYHLAIVYDKGSTNNNPIFYVNGVVEANTESLTPDGTVGSDAAKTLVIGVHNDLSAIPYDGQMEDLRVLNRLANAKDASLHAAGYRGPLGGEVLWLSMNEARGVAGDWEGTSLGNGTNLLPDLSVNSNDGDPTNTPIGRASEAPRYGVAV